MKFLFNAIVVLFIVVANVEAGVVIHGENEAVAYQPYPYHPDMITGLDLKSNDFDPCVVRWEVTNGKIRDEFGNYTLSSLTLNIESREQFFTDIYVVWDSPVDSYCEIKHYKDDKLYADLSVWVKGKCDSFSLFDQNLTKSEYFPHIYSCMNVDLENVVVESGVDVWINGFQTVKINPNVSILSGSNVSIRAGGMGQSSFSGNQMRMAAGINTMESDGNKCTLKQNYPNPFSQTTSIDCFVPSIKTVAYIQITDIRGILVKKIPVTQIGWNEMQVDSSELGVGTYTYSLIVNNQLIESKQMFVIH